MYLQYYNAVFVNRVYLCKGSSRVKFVGFINIYNFVYSKLMATLSSIDACPFSDGLVLSK